LGKYYYWLYRGWPAKPYNLGYLIFPFLLALTKHAGIRILLVSLDKPWLLGQIILLTVMGWPADHYHLGYSIFPSLPACWVQNIIGPTGQALAYGTSNITGCDGLAG
jgi:hypothetical protein